MFSLRFPDSQDTALLSRAIFRANATGLDSSTDAQTLGFEYRDEAGLAVIKSFTFEPSHPYVVSFSVRAERSGRPLEASVHLGALGSEGQSQSSTSYVAPARAIVAKDGDVERIGAKDLSEPESAAHVGTFPFAGVDEHYFMSALVGRKSSSVSSIGR